MHTENFSALPELSYSSVLPSKLYISDVCKIKNNIWT